MSMDNQAQHIQKETERRYGAAFFRQFPEEAIAGTCARHPETGLWHCSDGAGNWALMTGVQILKMLNSNGREPGV